MKQNNQYDFKEWYYKLFGSTPPECIWTEMLNEELEGDSTFIYFNLYKTVIWKYIVKWQNTEFLTSLNAIGMLNSSSL